MTQKQLDETLNKLIQLGANEVEINLWRALYPTLSEEDKLKFDINFQNELKELSK